MAACAACAGALTDSVPLASVADQQRVGRATKPLDRTVAQALNAAWNARDLDGVLALFTEDAVVAEDYLAVSKEGGAGAVGVEPNDRYGMLVGHLDPDDIQAQPILAARGATVIWATGKTQIRSWVVNEFSYGHRADAEQVELDGDHASWRYRVTTEAANRSGLPPTEGMAVATLHGGRIATLRFTPDAASVERYQAAVNRILEARRAQVRAAVVPAAPERQAGLIRGPSSADWQWGVGLAVAAGLILVVRPALRPHRTESLTGPTGASSCQR